MAYGQDMLDRIKSNKDKDGNELDSCWGFFGWEYAVEQAKEALKNSKIPVYEDPNQLKLALENS